MLKRASGTPKTMSRAEELCKTLMEFVYGEVESPSFPKGLGPNEAGISLGSRRYLWTDAFGVLNYVSLAMKSEDRGSQLEKKQYLQAAKKLIDETLFSLGNPMSDAYPMAEKENGQYKGLRIGKVHARQESDPGMQFDGMYWHYLDKFLFALQRYSKCARDESYLQKATTIINDVHSNFFVPNRGFHWKLNTDLTRIRGMDANPSHDVVSAFVVYNLINMEGGNLSKEIRELRPVVERYFTEMSSREVVMETRDSLGLGMHLWTLQWLVNQGPQDFCCYENTCSRGEKELKNCILSFRKEVITGASIVIDEAISSEGSLPFRCYGALLGCEVELVLITLILDLQMPFYCSITFRFVRH